MQGGNSLTLIPCRMWKSSCLAIFGFCGMKMEPNSYEFFVFRVDAYCQRRVSVLLGCAFPDPLVIENCFVCLFVFVFCLCPTDISELLASFHQSGIYKEKAEAVHFSVSCLGSCSSNCFSSVNFSRFCNMLFLVGRAKRYSSFPSYPKNGNQFISCYLSIVFHYVESVHPFAKLIDSWVVSSLELV